MGGLIEDTFTEIITLGSAQTATYNQDDIDLENEANQATFDAETLIYDEALKEERFTTELTERMQTGGYRSLIGGNEVKDTVASGEFVSELDTVDALEVVEGESFNDYVDIDLSVDLDSLFSTDQPEEDEPNTGSSTISI